MTIDKDGLAPCPLCAAQMLLERFVDWESQPLNVQHIVHPTPTTCPLAGVQIEASTEAIAAWNRRALPNTGDELVARLRQVPRHEGHSYPVEGAIRVVPYGNMLNDAADAIASLTARAQAAEASLASAREDALEEAAKVHEAEIAMIQGHLAGDEIDQYSYSKLVLLLGSHHNSLSAIRALKEVR